MKNKRNKTISLSNPYLLFDAGGTLVFPDQSLMIGLAESEGVELTNRQLYKGYYQLIFELDKAWSQSPQDRSKQEQLLHPWPRGYAYALFENIGLLNRRTCFVAERIEELHRLKNIWSFTFEWVRNTLSYLHFLGYRMSIISNSDGRTKGVFSDLGMDHYFDEIFDSHILGIAKPEPAIFELVLKELNLQASQALFIGDIFEVDVRGANSAGIGAIHIDPLRLYRNKPGVHLRDVRCLPDWLSRFARAPHTFDIQPFRSWKLCPNRITTTGFQVKGEISSEPFPDSRITQGVNTQIPATILEALNI
ncbi:MAG: HAD family hydrolase [Chloroflexota bacterium]